MSQASKSDAGRKGRGSDPQSKRGSDNKDRKQTNPYTPKKSAPVKIDGFGTSEPGPPLSGYANAAKGLTKAQRETHNLDHAREQPAEEPLTDLSELMHQFVDIKLGDYSGCAKFCAENPDIWNEDPNNLNDAVRKCMETALRLAQRYVTLSHACKSDTGKHSKQQILDLLGSKPKLREDLNQEAEQLLQSFSAKKSASSVQERPTKGVGKNDGGEEVEGDDDGEEAEDDEHRSPTPKPLLPRQYAVPPVASVTGVSIAPNRTAGSSLMSPRPRSESSTSGPPVDIVSNAGTVDTVDDGSVEGGERPFIGPVSDIVDQLNLTFLHRFELHEGAKLDQVFAPGSMIAVFWHENYGSKVPSKLKSKVENPNQPKNVPHNGGYVTRVGNGALVYSKVRRFIVVNKRQGFSVAIPIASYSGRGVLKNISEREQQAHTIVYSHGKKPVRLKEEPSFTKRSICVKMHDQDEKPLSQTSRLYYAQPFSILHNTRVQYLGRVLGRDFPSLLQDYADESRAPLKRPSNVGETRPLTPNQSSVTDERHT